MDESIWRLLVSDGRRCLSSLQEPDACSASGMFEECKPPLAPILMFLATTPWPLTADPLACPSGAGHCKVTSWLETRKPIVQVELTPHPKCMA